MPKSLVEVFHSVFDPRSRQGLIHDLVPTLSLAVVAILAGRTSLAGIARFGRDHGPTLAHALGFRRGTTPSLTTYSRLFRRIDVEAFETALGDWIVPRCPDLGDHFALDGKTLRGSRDGDTPAVHLLSVYAPKVQAVIGQLRVEAKTNEHKAALRLLGVLPSLKGKVVTGDAMFCQTEIADVLEKHGADYVLHVKDNQPTVKEKIAELLDPVGSFSPAEFADPDVTAARTVNKGHGRVEVRTAQSCDLLKSWLRAMGFAGAEQVIRVERVRTVNGEKTVSVEYYLSSLSRFEASAFDFLRWIRAHWAIENGLHYVRDETLGEDRCRVRKGGSSQVLAALRNAALHLMHDAGESNRKAATERFQIHPEEAIDLIHTRQCET